MGVIEGSKARAWRPYTPYALRIVNAEGECVRGDRVISCHIRYVTQWL